MAVSDILSPGPGEEDVQRSMSTLSLDRAIHDGDVSPQVCFLLVYVCFSWSSHDMIFYIFPATTGFIDVHTKRTINGPFGMYLYNTPPYDEMCYLSVQRSVVLT